MKADNTQSPQHLQNLRRIFQGLSDEVLAHILQHSGKYQLEPGEYLFRQGTHGNTLYIVLQGRLRAVRQDEGTLMQAS